jgi:GTP cyclohydrolase IA
MPANSRLSSDPLTVCGREHIEAFIKWLGDDPTRSGLVETPSRFFDAWREWSAGYDRDPVDVLKVFEDGGENYRDLVFQGNIPVYSHCEHHLTSFFGVAHVGYIPDGKIVGLSKLARVVDIFAKRLQVQERLTRQVAEALYNNLKPSAVGVVLRCRHLCMESRGVQKTGTITYTSCLLGKFMTEPETRAEFLGFVDRSDQRLSVV